MDLASQLAKIELDLKEKIESAMNTEVAKEAVKITKKNIDKMVYSYHPMQYERTGLLRDTLDSKKIDYGTEIYSPYEENNKHIATVVETGEGYDYTGLGYEYEQPRPFMKESEEEMERTNKIITAFSQGMRRQGVAVRSILKK